MSDLVNHPSHYNKEGKMECWTEMEQQLDSLVVIYFCLGSAYKYYYRAGLKDGNPEEQDKAKIVVYMKKAEKQLKKMGLCLDSLDAWVNYNKLKDILESEGIYVRAEE